MRDTAVRAAGSVMPSGGEQPYQRGDRRTGAAPGEVIAVEVEESRSRVHRTSFACLNGRLGVK